MIAVWMRPVCDDVTIGMGIELYCECEIRSVHHGPVGFRPAGMLVVLPCDAIDNQHPLQKRLAILLLHHERTPVGVGLELEQLFDKEGGDLDHFVWDTPPSEFGFNKSIFKDGQMEPAECKPIGDLIRAWDNAPVVVRIGMDTDYRKLIELYKKCITSVGSAGPSSS